MIDYFVNKIMSIKHFYWNQYVENPNKISFGIIVFLYIFLILLKNQLLAALVN